MLPLRVHEELAAIVGVRESAVELRVRDADDVRWLLWALPATATSSLVLMFRVHSRAGIPLAWAPGALVPGDSQVESSPLTVLAMEGYAHVTPDQRRRVEERVLARGAFCSVGPL